MESDFVEPVNIGSEEMVTINELAEYVMEVAGKKLTIKHITGPLGVRGRNSDNKLTRGVGLYNLDILNFINIEK